MKYWYAPSASKKISFDLPVEPTEDCHVSNKIIECTHFIVNRF